MDTGKQENKSLASRVITAGSWTIGGFALGQLFRLASNLIMTRLLVPEMFGIMALTQVFLYIMTLISDIGIRPSIIRSKRGEESLFLNTAWTVGIVRGMLITSLVLVAAFGIKILNDFGFFAENSAYTTADLPLIIAVMSITSLINSFSSTNVILAGRKLLLGRLTVVELVSQVFGIAIMIGWAFLIERSIWALVSGALATSIIYTVLSHTAFPGIRNKFAWDKSAFWEIFHFGKWVLVSSIVSAILAQGDRLILGDLLSAESLGIYAIAYFLASSVKQAVFRLNGMVFFPLFSEIKRERADSMASIYYKIRRKSDALTMTIAGILFISGEKIVEFLFDDRYLEAGWMLSILSFSLLLTGPIISGALFLAIDKPKYVSFMSACETVVLIAGLPIVYSIGGFDWAIWVLALYSLGAIPLDYYYKHKLGVLNVFKEIHMLPIVLVGCGIGLIFNYVVKFAI